MVNSEDSLPDLDAWLVAHDNPGAELELSRFEVVALRQEIARLTQSADFLRKQNKKLRGRIAKLKGGEIEAEPVEDPESTEPS